MATTPTEIKGSPRGITNTLTGFVVENERIVDAPVQEDVPDQNGAQADEIVYDNRKNLNLTVYGATSSASIASVIEDMPDGYTGKRIKYPSGNGGVYYKVDSVEEAGTYNGRRRWTITGHKFDNFPPQTAAASGSNT
ncbi:MAG: hypothetical protein IJJ84_12295 [Kiritimatiellae bacterium]|nr:hypothetical protein [Kiritimatiellia bacterium]